MASIENISVEGFKKQFARDSFPYLPLYQEGKAYFINEAIYAAPNFYKCLVDGTTTPPPSENWELYNDTIDNYISDEDIERAFIEAKGTFNINFFTDDITAEMYFYYVAAHYLTTDINNARNALNMGYFGYTQSKSVGSVSESYGFPAWVTDNPVLGMLAQTGYGRKYLLYVIPIAKAKTFIYTAGCINFG